MRTAPSHGGSFFGRIGYHDTTFVAESYGYSVDVGGNGYAAGVGGEYFWTDNLGARFDATYFHIDSVESDGYSAEVDDGSTVLSVSLVYKF